MANGKRIASVYAEIGADTRGLVAGLKTGEKALNELEKEAKETGAALDKVISAGSTRAIDAYTSALRSGNVTQQDFQNTLLDTAQAYGLSNTQIMRMTRSSGMFSDEQRRAASVMMLTQRKADELAQAVAQGKMSAKDAGAAFAAYSNTLKTGKQSMTEYVGGLVAFAAKAATVAGVLAGIGYGVKSLADEFMNYAFQVDDLSRTIGATPEQASKLIQVADDVRVSYETLTTALEAAIRKGVEPTIEGLGRMSDEYLKLEPGVKRAAYLMENFGRSGNDLARLMEMGSQKIQEAGDSIEGTALLMTQAGVDAATEYWQSIDALSDSFTSLKSAMASIALPVVVPAMKGFAAEAWIASKAINALGKGLSVGEFMKLSVVLAEAQQELMQGRDATVLLTAAEKYLTAAIGGQTVAIGDQSEAWQDIRQKTLAAVSTQYKLTENTMAAVRVQGEYSDTLTETSKGLHTVAGNARGAAGAIQKVASAWDVLNNVDTGILGDMGTALANLKYSQAGGRNVNWATEWLKSQRNVSKDQLLALAAADIKVKSDAGLTTPREGLDELKTSAGLAKDELAKVKKFLEELNGMSVQAFLQLNVTGTESLSGFKGAGGGGAGGGKTGTGTIVYTQAAGGDMWPGRPYLTGERGPEWIVPKVPATTYNSQVSRSMGGGGGGGDTYNIYNYNQQTAALAMAIVAERRRARLNASMG